MNFLDGTVKEDGGRVYLEVNGTAVELSKERSDVAKNKGYVGKEVVVGGYQA